MRERPVLKANTASQKGDMWVACKVYKWATCQVMGHKWLILYMYLVRNQGIAVGSDNVYYVK